MKVTAVGFLLAAAVASSVSAQDAPSEVTDGEIARYKATAQSACREAGMARGDPQVQIDGFCSCVLESLTKTMTRPEWQQASFYSMRNQADEEKKVLAPHVQNLGFCRK